MVRYHCERCGKIYSLDQYMIDRFCTCGKLLTKLFEAIPFDELWQSILDKQGSEFETKTGSKFTYKMQGNILHPSATEWNIPRSDFEKAYKLFPLDGPGKINKLVQGPAYVWAILHKLG